MSLQPPVFKHITEDVLREWKSPTAASAPLKLPGVPLPRFLYELCWALVRGDLPLQKCKTALESAEFAGHVTAEDVASVFADIIAHLVLDPLMTGEYRARLVKLVKWLVDSAIIPSMFFQERCEEQFLWESELSKIMAQDLKAKEVRVNTRLLYQQTKFNLLREESEGYAKLVTLLCHGGLETAQEATPEATISLIKVDDQERDKGNVLKGDIDAAAALKKRKLKRDLPTDTVREYSPAVPSLHPPGSLGNSQPFDGRERGDRKAAMVPHRSPYLEETVQRLHGKEAGGKITRREADQNLERDWEEEKQLRNEAKRKHRK